MLVFFLTKSSAEVETSPTSVIILQEYFPESFSDTDSSGKTEEREFLAETSFPSLNHEIEAAGARRGLTSTLHSNSTDFPWTDFTFSGCFEFFCNAENSQT